MDRRDHFASFGQLLPQHKIDESRKVLIFTIDDGEGEEVEHELPIAYCVCGTCNGSGTHVNPSIDAHGITAEEWDRDWSDDDREGYLNGRYDVTCTECGGKRVTPDIDEKRADPAVLKILRDWQSEESDYRSICEAERRMGA